MATSSQPKVFKTRQQRLAELEQENRELRNTVQKQAEKIGVLSRPSEFEHAFTVLVTAIVDKRIKAAISTLKREVRNG